MKGDTIINMLAYILVILLIFAVYSLNTWNNSMITRFPLTKYSCEEIKGAIINQTCLEKAHHELWGGVCYQFSDMDPHYKYRCEK